MVENVGHTAYGSAVRLADLQQLYALEKGHSWTDANARAKVWSLVPSVPRNARKRILVTGGAGFVGSHLVDRLMLMGNEVIVVDNYFTGTRENVLQWEGHPNFELIRHDVVDPINLEVDQIYHLACA